MKTQDLLFNVTTFSATTAAKTKELLKSDFVYAYQEIHSNSIIIDTTNPDGKAEPFLPSSEIPDSREKT